MWKASSNKINDCQIYKSLFDSLNYGVCNMDLEGNIHLANNKMLQLFEIDKSAENCNIKNYFPEPFFKINDLSDGEEKIMAIIKEGKIVKEVNACFKIIFSPNSNNKEIVASFFEVKKYNNRVQENLYEEIFHKSSRAQAMAQNFHFTEVNQAYLNLYGYKREELLGMPVMNMMSEQSQQFLIELKQRKDQGEFIPQFYQIEGKKRDGSIFPIEVELNFLSLPGGETVIFSAKDISQEKASKEILISSESKFRGVFNASMLGISFTNTSQEITEANDKFLSIVGYTRDDLRNKTFTWETLTPPECYETDIKAINDYFITGSIAPYEKEILRKDGTRVPVLVAASSLERSPLGVGFIVDLSEIKNIKKETEKLTKELSTYIYMASHDLKGPLASVIGLTAVAKSEITDEKALNYLDLIRKSTLKLDRSLVNLMKIMKIKNNQLDIAPIDFISVVDEVLMDLKYMEDFGKCKIERSVTLKRPFFSDKELIKSVFQNLIENSIKYHSNIEKPEIQISIEDSESSISLIIKDNGKGIDEKIKDKIFDMFFRGTLESKGSGLGLYIVKSAIDQLQGKIEVQNKEFGGCQFSIHLPKIFSLTAT